MKISKYIYTDGRCSELRFLILNLLIDQTINQSDLYKKKLGPAAPGSYIIPKRSDVTDTVVND